MLVESLGEIDKAKKNVVEKKLCSLLDTWTSFKNEDFQNQNYMKVYSNQF